MSYWSTGRIVLGLSDDEFFDMTPVKFFALLDQHEARTMHTELMFGQVCSAIINWSESRPEKSVPPCDFMPSQWGKPKPKAKRVNQQRLSARIDALFEPMVKKTEEASITP